MNRKQIGQLGEKIACYYLRKKGYKILDRNYVKEWSSVSKGEIDIVAKKKNVISFVEVKAMKEIEDKRARPFAKGERTGSFIYLPEYKVNFQKQRKLFRLAQSWLIDNKIPLESEWQIDVVSIRFSPDLKKARVRYFKNVRRQ